ncbi:MAG: hypothetical protein EPN47_02435 [Acidobacteria bacterium]|nr:MAG: hypothetical protein EPN47_02435 [Acidobacteriota bacterium]
MELQHVNVKLLLKNDEGLDLGPLIEVFHSWIQLQGWDELLLDVADYRHVHAGPGVILIGYEANYSVDNTGNRPGVRYNRKAAVDGSNQDRLKQATVAALKACRRFESDPRLNSRFLFNGQEIEISINDRLLAPNIPETREAIQSELAPLLNKLFAGAEYSLSYEDSPRSLFSVSVKPSGTFSVEELLQNLS